MSPVAAEARDPQPGDIEALLADIRPADLAEGEALGGAGQVPRMLADSVKASVHPQTVEADGKVVCMFGVAPIGMLADQALVWMVGTSLVETNRRALTRIGRAYIARMLHAYPTLMNVVDQRNDKAIRWLKATGFTVHPAQPIGGAMFHPFTLGA